MMAARAVLLTLILAVPAAPAVSQEQTLERTAATVKSVERKISALRRLGAGAGDIARSTDRMINGIAHFAGIKEGWIASIFLDGVFTCGGAVVNFTGAGADRITQHGQGSEYYLITAGHCFGKNPGILSVSPVQDAECHFLRTEGITVGLGSFTLEEQKAKAVKPRHICRHHKYSDNPLLNDIAIVGLPRLDRQTAPHVSGITMATPDDHLLYAERARVTALGWGPESASAPEIQDTLLRIDLPVAGSNTCADDQENGFFCAGFSTGGTGVCNGDSGSPAVFLPLPGESKKIGARMISLPIFMGVTSFSEQCGANNTDSVFVDIRRYSQWITATTDRLPLKEERK